MVLTWLLLSAKVVTSLPSTTRLTRVFGPTQCAVGPSLKSKEEWQVATTCTATSVTSFLGWMPCCGQNLPLRSLNVPGATYGKSPGEGNPSQSGQMHHTQRTCVPYVGNGPSLWSCACSTLLFDQTQAFPTHETQGLV